MRNFFHQLDSRLLAAFIMGVVVWVVISSNLSRPPLLNNGDYGRTVRSTMRIPIMEQLDWPCARVTNRDMNWRSVTSILYFFQVKASYFLKSQCVGHKNMLWMQASIYALGSALLILSSATPFRALLLVALPFWLFGEFLGSFYEEGGVLAFLPLWLYSAMMINSGRAMWLLYLGMSCIVLYGKSQNAALLPGILVFYVCAFSRSGSAEILRKIFFSLVVAGIAYLSAWSHEQNKIPNSYNRIFNGVGWSMQRVDEWPARDFLSRRDYFESKSPGIDTQGEIVFPSDFSDFMGTSYWPDGHSLSQVSLERYNLLISKLTPSVYLEIVSNPDVLVRLVVATYRVMLDSYYGLGYLRVGGEVDLHREVFFKSFGWVYLVVILGFLACYRGSPWLYLLPLNFAMLPVIVVFGDGFYEFEKHMVAFYILLPFLGVIFLKKFCQNGVENFR